MQRTVLGGSVWPTRRAASTIAARASAAAGVISLAILLGSGGCSDDESSTPTTTASAGGGGGTSSTSTSSTSTSSTSTSSTSTSSTSTSSTSSAQGGSGGAEPGWYGTLPTLANDALCYEWGSVTPAEGEAGHLYAVRLTPPSYPFVVDEVQYELWGEGGCDNSFAHRIEIFVDSTTSPPASPAAPVVIDVPAATSNEMPVRVVQQSLPTPIELAQDEHIFVALELPNVDTSCVAVCANASFDDRDYWSGAVAAPYDWQTLASFGFHVSARIGANGATP